MTTKLYYRGTDGVDVFVDAETNTVYHPSDRPHDVPDERVEWFLSHAGWERPDRSEVQDVGEGSIDDTVRVMPSEPVQADDSEAESESNGDGDSDGDDGEPSESDSDTVHEEHTDSEVREALPDDVGSDTAGTVEPVDDEEFDAGSFLDGHAHTVASRIRQGAADGHLDALETAEKEREGAPREGTVLKAIEARRTDLDTDDEE